LIIPGDSFRDRRMIGEIEGDTKKRELLKTPTKIEEIKKKF